MILRVTLAMAVAGVFVCAPTFCAEPPVEALSVCEVVRDLPAMEGKTVAVVGRYSFRDSGISLGEQTCDPAAPAPAQLRLKEDPKSGPKPSGVLEIEAAGLRRKLADLKKRTSLGKFRFGSADYDRWAVIYGRVEAAKTEDGKPPAASLVFRGDGVVIFLTE